MLRTIIFALALTFLSQFAFAHDYHASITDARYNPRSQSLEVAIKVFVDDLEEALSRRSKKKVVYNRSAQVQQYVQEYIGASLSFELEKGKPLRPTFVGAEQEADVVWVYLEVPLKTPVLTHLYVRNVVLQELFSDQMNIVNLDYKGKVSSTLFQKNDGTRKMGF
ncbi:hypothetical protein H9Q13_14790 [Pontibacter sp. JH31]|uniref:Uncharacterized protein n=1 Tax=Pontibacter aquaedesilientis TaxID=2766980 RepID=A0ABR7XJI2_9BACT|nr:DUF6702 family protein [Pontibacter aquaedesilientis]MBD1398436.1 hypothetical protein [Pontibacter aquaedesilientis]